MGTHTGGILWKYALIAHRYAYIHPVCKSTNVVCISVNPHHWYLNIHIKTNDKVTYQGAIALMPISIDISPISIGNYEMIEQRL